jgi:hypothetical protein
MTSLTLLSAAKLLRLGHQFRLYLLLQKGWVLSYKMDVKCGDESIDYENGAAVLYIPRIRFLRNTPGTFLFFEE